MRIAGIPFYPAHSSNFTRGRNRPIKYITIHHSAGWEQTLRYLWGDPNRNASSHFWVGNGHVEQYVDTDDTAWTNGNFASNSESITIEVRGDWRGYYDQATLNKLEELLRVLRKNYPTAGITYHQDVSSVYTLCPADLKHKGYARRVWDNVTAWLAPKPTPTPTPAPALTYRPITPKRVKLIRTANLWNFNFSSWAQAKAVGEAYQAGHLVDVVAIGRNSLGGEYYMTSYSYNGGNVRATNGFNTKDCEDYVPAITLPPTIELKWEPLDKARKLRTAMPVQVTNLDTMELIGDVIPKDKDIDMVEKKTLANNRMYIRSAWAKTNGKNWGIPMDQLVEIVPEVPREPIPEPPIDVDPETPSDSDVVIEAKGIIEAIKALLDKLLSLFTRSK